MAALFEEKKSLLARRRSNQLSARRGDGHEGDICRDEGNATATRVSIEEAENAAWPEQRRTIYIPC